MTMLDLTPTQRVLHEQHKARQRRFYLASLPRHYSPPMAEVRTEPEPEPKAPTVKETNGFKIIQHIVADHFGLTMAEFLMHRRMLRIARPRQIAMYLCRELLQKSYPEIGRRFGGRDHTTVLSAMWKIEEMMAADPVFAATVEKLKEMARGVLDGRGHDL